MIVWNAVMAEASMLSWNPLLMSCLFSRVQVIIEGGLIC